jgi:putative hydrolase of HD superfamily
VSDLSRAGHDLAAAREAMGLKDVARAGWLRVGVDHPESVAAHSWGVALLALLRCPAGLDREKVLAMAILHDLAEVRVGDLTPQDGVPREEKHHRERVAMRAMLGHRPELLDLWEEAEACVTPEARFLKHLDKADMGLQAEVYAARGVATAEFTESAAPAMKVVLPGA